MFLAINEIRHSKLRYALVTGVMCWAPRQVDNEIE